jgi:4Fe-4S ferredoxin
MECTPEKSLEPVINRARCEGKEDCVRVCPKNVFEIRTVSLEEREALHVGAKLKLWIHGGRQAYAVRSGACDACGACITSCPEKAITLRARA